MEFFFILFVALRDNRMFAKYVYFLQYYVRPTLKKYFCFPLPDPVLPVWVSQSEKYFLTSQIGYPLNLIVYSNSCLKRPLNERQNIVCFF